MTVAGIRSPLWRCRRRTRRPPRDRRRRRSQALGRSGPLVGFPVDAGGIQAPDVLLGYKYARMPEQVTQHHQRVRFGQVEHQRRVRTLIGAGRRDQPGSLQIMPADKVLQRRHRKRMPQPMGVHVRKSWFEACADPVGRSLEHRRPRGERPTAIADRDQARSSVRRDQPAPLAGVRPSQLRRTPLIRPPRSVGSVTISGSPHRRGGRHPLPSTVTARSSSRYWCSSASAS